MKALLPRTRTVLQYAKAINSARAARVSNAEIIEALKEVGVVGITRDTLYYYRMQYFSNDDLMSYYEQLPLPSLGIRFDQASSAIDSVEASTTPTPRQEAPAETTPTPPPSSVPATTSEELPPKRPRVQPIDHLPPRRQNIEICTGDPIVIAEGVIAQWGRWKKGIMPGPKFICQIVGPELKVRFGTRLEQGTWAWAYEFCDVPYTVELIMQEAAVCEMQNKPPDTPIDDQFTMPYGKAPILKEYAEWYEAHEEERNKDAR